MTEGRAAQIAAAVRLLSETFDPGGSLDPEIDEWVKEHSRAIFKVEQLVAAIPPAPMETADNRKHARDAKLDCRIDKDRLVIEIGIDTLAFATKDSPTLYQRYGYDYDKGEERKDFVTINDPDVWAKEVQRQIESESEDGSSLMTKLFDDAIERAIDDGAEGIDIPSIGLVDNDEDE